MSGQASALGGCVLMEDIAYLLGAVVGDFDTDMGLICREGCAESFLLTLREPITRGAQEIADLIEGITLASTVTGRVLLDATAYLIKGIASELDDVKGVQHAGGVLELVINGVLISLEGIQPLRSGRGSDAACRHGLIWDHTVFHVVPNWRARPEIVAP